MSDYTALLSATETTVEMLDALEYIALDDLQDWSGSLDSDTETNY
jgi:hypothetical protein